MSIVRISKEADKKLGAYVAAIIPKNRAVVGNEFLCGIGKRRRMRDMRRRSRPEASPRAFVRWAFAFVSAQAPPRTNLAGHAHRRPETPRMHGETLIDMPTVRIRLRPLSGLRELAYICSGRIFARSKCTRLPAPVAEAATVRGCQRRAFADTGKRRQHGLHGLERGERGVLRTEHETALPTRNFTKMPHDSELRQSAKSDVRSVCQRCAVANGARLPAPRTAERSETAEGRETLRVRYWTAGRVCQRHEQPSEARQPKAARTLRVRYWTAVRARRCGYGTGQRRAAIASVPSPDIKEPTDKMTDRSRFTRWGTWQ